MSTIDIRALIEILFSEHALHVAYRERHADSVSRGLDRRNGLSFESVAFNELRVASKKCIDASYRFTPYLEVLKVKDRSSPPRIVSIPTIRDRIILTQLNKLIRLCFLSESKTRLASEYIRQVTDDISKFNDSDTWTAGLDIKKFYDSIDRVRLIKIIYNKIDNEAARALITRAINTPTVPKVYKSKEIGKYRVNTGVPQGLAISNSLAAIYMSDVDTPMLNMGVKYYRFVDDVLLVGSKDATARAAKSFIARIRVRGLSVHKEGSKKRHHLPLSQPFGYLGYVFRMPKVTVRESTVEKLLQSLAAMVTDYKYGRESALSRRAYLTAETYRAAFLDELNERISGAISGRRRYGWVAYFSQINDLSVLHRLDSSLRGIVARNSDLAPRVATLKKFARAYFEIKYRPNTGYVRNYDKFETTAQKLSFLVFRGQVRSDVALTPEQIVEKFEAYRERQLNAMLADEAIVY